MQWHTKTFSTILFVHGTGPVSVEAGPPRMEAGPAAGAGRAGRGRGRGCGAARIVKVLPVKYIEPERESLMARQLLY
jgi:hypothetical protein